VELQIRHTTPDICCTQLYSLTMTKKPYSVTSCFYWRPCSCNMLLYMSPQFAKSATNKLTTGDSCDGGVC